MEMELKLLLDPAYRHLVEDHPLLAEVEPDERTQITTYYDTADLDLLRQGASLRVRQSGESFVQTVKLDRPDTGVGIRGEWEWPVGSAALDLAALASLPEQAVKVRQAAARAEPVFTTEVNRSSRLLSLDEGVVIEAVIDQGTIRAGARSAEISEVELELKEGPGAPLFRLAIELADRAGLRFGPESKAARGYGLMTDVLPPGDEAGIPPWPGNTTVGTAFPRLVHTTLRALAAEIPAASRRQVEGVHRMRAAIRKLRSILVMFDPHLDRPAVQRFNVALRDLGRVLGRGRDWDVFLTETLPAAERSAHGAAAALLRGPAEQRSAEAHAAIGETLQGHLLTGLILGLGAWTIDTGWLRGVDAETRLADLAPGLLDRLDRTVRKRARKLDRHGHIADYAEDLHGLRKSLKKLRYGLEHVGSLFGGKPVARHLHAIKGVLSTLGDFNDAVVTEHRIASIASPDKPELAPAAAAALAWNAERAAAATEKLGKKLRRLRNVEPCWK